MDAACVSGFVEIGSSEGVADTVDRFIVEARSLKKAICNRWLDFENREVR